MKRTIKMKKKALNGVLIKLVYPVGMSWQNGKRTLDLEVASCDDHSGIRKGGPTIM